MTDAFSLGRTTGSGVAVPRSATAGTLARRKPRGSNLPALLVLSGIILPSGLQLFVAGAKLTPARIALLLLFIPSVAKLLGRGRRLIPSDGLAVLVGVIMVAAAGYAAGAQSMVSATAESLDFVGGYLVARAYFIEPRAIDGFVRLLKMFTVVAICIAIVEVISGRWIVRDALTSMLGQEPTMLDNAAAAGDAIRGGLRRAASTFDHPILFGVFCSLVGAITFATERTRIGRLSWAGICGLGTLLSLSSAAAISLGMVILGNGYEALMRRYRWRWTFLWSCLAAAAVVVILAANHPIGWVISHLTYDPQTGFYRILIWDAATTKIFEHPYTGYGFVLFGDYILDKTVDSVWLVLSIHYGIPLSLAVIMLNISAFWPTRWKSSSRVQAAFTMVLLVYMFAGLTVHFWNYMLTFWGVCIGIRASFREQPRWTVKDDQ